MSTFLQQLQGEAVKLFARKRTYIGFGAFLLLEVVLFFVFQLQGPEKFFEKMINRQGGAFDHYFSGITLAYIILRLSVFLLGGLYLTLVGGDIVAKESEDGHLRLLLARPVSRLRLLTIKYLTCTGYAFVLIQFIAWSALILGIAMKGWGGGFFAFSPEQGVVALYEWGAGMQRYLLAAFFLGLAMTTISSVAFFFSCFPIKPAAATITALSYALIDMILRESNFLEDYKHLLITTYISSWARLVGDPIEWALVVRNFTVIGAMNISLFIVGVAVFSSRDLKS